MNRRMRDLLYRSFDDTLSDEEQHRLDMALAQSPALNAEYKRLVRMRRMVSGHSTETFGPWFAERVINRIKASGAPGPELFFDALFSMFRHVAIAVSVAMLLIIAYNLIQSDMISLAATFGLYEPTLEEMLDVTVALESEGAL